MAKPFQPQKPASERPPIDGRWTWRPSRRIVRPPANAAVGGFPTSGSPTPRIAEEVRRNRPMFDYILNNILNTQTGLAEAYSRSFEVDIPTTAIAVKGDWIPVETLLQWLPFLESIENINELYYTGSSYGTVYALVSLHVISR